MFHVTLVTLVFMSLGSLTNMRVAMAAPGHKVRQTLDEWITYSVPPEHGAVRTCANYSKHVWSVSLEDGVAHVGPYHESPWNRSLLPDLKDTGASVDSVSAALALEDGWLIGVDRGEFGGALWWLRGGGVAGRKLLDQNVKAIVSAGDEFRVLTGLAHLRSSAGALYRLQRKGGDWTATYAQDLGAAPDAVFVGPGDSILVLTTEALLRLRPSGEVTRIHDAGYGGLYPNSLVVAMDGATYIGMRHFVVRLWPTGGGFREEWLVPRYCARFVERNYDCVCLGQ